MFPVIQVPKEIDSYLSRLFDVYKADILALHDKQWKDEDIRGESVKQYTILQYYLAFYYVIMIWYEVSQGVNLEWSYYEEKYDIDTIREKLACNKIDLDILLAVFGLPITTTEGIGGMEVEESLIVGNAVETTITTVDIQNLLSIQEEFTTLVSLEDTFDYELDYTGELIP